MSGLETIRTLIRTACKKAARDVSSVTLVAVTKNRSEEEISGLLDQGVRVFGENRVQEAQTHWQNKRPRYPDLQLHLIGPLQTNKVKDAVALFDVIETVDRIELVDALVKECQKQNKFPRFFIQINIGEEPQKSGIAITDLPTLLAHTRTAGLKVEGLMCIPPADGPPALYFALLKKLANRYDLPHTSMGMSSDFVKAITLGASHIRIGTALFETQS
ncbi:MAG: YggS family pyridoxal phosphate-dependent enzyme [Methylomonas sp.]|nr:YggS family pyridoxal phosphate-dependent enzyme [Methylomonas sp.]